MNTSKSIDISKSSLISLKAELSRKQDEVQKAKANKLNSDSVPHLSKLKKNIFEKRTKKKEEKTDECIQQNRLSVDDDDDALKKSREILEVKSKLYDHLEERVLTTECGKSEYLVNFDQKNIDKQKEDETVNVKSATNKHEELSDSNSFPEDDEDDWVDFTDALGRSRRCLRKDLEYMKKNDDELAKQLKPPTPPQVAHEESEISQEMLSSDMYREMRRQKWEEQEQKLLNKTDIHYQDLLFDEARTHGVGYYSFSTDEDERAKQQRELLRLRQDTLHRQEEAQGLRNRRNQQLQARLKAARMRNRQRLGLPPEEEDKSKDQNDVVITGESENVNSKDADTSQRLEELEKSLKRAAHVRPWDVGKDGVQTQQVMSQEEWVEQKRDERVSEFAPPSAYLKDYIPEMSSTSSKRGKSGLFFTSKKLRSSTSVESVSDDMSQLNKQTTTERFSKIKNEVGRNSDTSEESEQELEVNKNVRCRKGAEIPPPPTMDYYSGMSHKPKKDKNKKTSSKDIKDSISEGLKYLQKQNEMKEQKREKGLLDIV